jgi:hypothetical protein
MANPDNSRAMDERRSLLRLLDRLDDVQPGRHCIPDAIVDRWVHSDADTRRRIEDSIDGLPRRKKPG